MSVFLGMSSPELKASDIPGLAVGRQVTFNDHDQGVISEVREWTAVIRFSSASGRRHGEVELSFDRFQMLPLTLWERLDQD
jgi:hypothetical protein